MRKNLISYHKKGTFYYLNIVQINSTIIIIFFSSNKNSKWLLFSLTQMFIGNDSVLENMFYDPKGRKTHSTNESHYVQCYFSFIEEKKNKHISTARVIRATSKNVIK